MTIDVYVQNELIGKVEKSLEKHNFAYALDAQQAISLTMPARLESYTHEQLHPIFQMNLPEGQLKETLENMVNKRFGSNDLSLLAILGNNQIGRLQYTLSGQALPNIEGNQPVLEDILSSQDANLFSDLLQTFAQSSGVAGVQPKVLADIRSKITLNLDSYIVKSWGAEFPELACNEYVCLMFAKIAGLCVPEFFLSDNGKLLLTKRFDYNPTRQKLGFEDFCVLQGKGTKEKYDASLESCANTIQQFVSPEFKQQALADFFKLTLINIIVKNGDAHLKNYGILYDNLANYQQGKLLNTKRQLAPIYDIVSTVPYLKNDIMALSLTGSKRWPKWKVLQTFAKQHCQLKNKDVEQIVDEVKTASLQIPSLLQTITQQHPNFTPIANNLDEIISTHGLWE